MSSAQITAGFTCGNFMIDLQPATSFANAVVTAPTITFEANGKPTNAWQYNLGAPNQIMVMRVMYLWPVFLGPLGLNLVDVSNNTHLLMSTAVIQERAPMKTSAMRPGDVNRIV